MLDGDRLTSRSTGMEAGRRPRPVLFNRIHGQADGIECQGQGSACVSSSSRPSAGTQPQSYRVPSILPAPTGY